MAVFQTLFTETDVGEGRRNWICPVIVCQAYSLEKVEIVNKAYSFFHGDMSELC
jgi:hypothetical protein